MGTEDRPLTPREVKALRKRLQGRVKLSKKELAEIAETNHALDELEKEVAAIRALPKEVAAIRALRKAAREAGFDFWFGV